MAGKYGITNIKKVAAFGLELGNAAYKATHKNENALQKAAEFLAVSDEVAGLLDLDLDMLQQEYFDLDETEMGELKDFVGKKLDISDHELEETVEAVFSYGFDLVKAFQGLISVWDK